MGSGCGYRRNKVSHELELLNLGDGYIGAHYTILLTFCMFEIFHNEILF